MATKDTEVKIRINFIFGDKFFKSSINPTIKNRVPRIKII